MKAQQDKMVLRREDANLDVAPQPHRSRSSEEPLQRLVWKRRPVGRVVAEPNVEIDVRIHEGKRFASLTGLFWANAEVDVAVRPQTAIGIDSRSEPALEEDRLHVGRAQDCERRRYRALMQQGLQRGPPVRLAELGRCWREPERRPTNGSPGKRRSA
jgi:hypothetical protein